VEKVIFSWSGGKDSAVALYEIQRSQRYEILSLLTTITEDYDRVSLHGVPRTLVEQQAKSLGLPIQKVFIPKDCSNEEYEARMKQTLIKFKQAGVSRVVFGDVFLEEVRKYRENNLSKLEMTGLFPIWGRDSAELTRSFIALGFQAITICVDTRVLDKRFVGRIIDESFLAQLPPNVDPGGENGEFHSFVFDGPIFRDRIAYKLGEQVLRDSFYFCDLLPREEIKSKRKVWRGSAPSKPISPLERLNTKESQREAKPLLPTNSPSP
jgi:uncharacterized protein (TIGR00290 family)